MTDRRWPREPGLWLATALLSLVVFYSMLVCALPWDAEKRKGGWRG